MDTSRDDTVSTVVHGQLVRLLQVLLLEVSERHVSGDVQLLQLGDLLVYGLVESALHVFGQTCHDPIVK